jgi:hypothetical protein
MDTLSAELHEEILNKCSAKTIMSAFVSKGFFVIGIAILRRRSKRPDLYDIPADKLADICASSIRLRRKLCKNDYYLTVRGRFAFCTSSACKSKDPDLFAMACVRNPQRAHDARIVAAAAEGDNNTLSLLVKDAVITTELLKRLAVHGKLHRAGVMITKTKRLFIDACARGNMEMVTHLLTRCVEKSAKLITIGMITSGLRSNRLPCKKVFLYLLDRALTSDITAALNRLCQKAPSWVIYAMLAAEGSLRKRGAVGLCKGRRMDMIDLLCQYKADLSEYLSYAGRAGDISFIKTVHARGKCDNLNGAMAGACEMYRMSICDELIAMGASHCSFCDATL